MKLNLGCGGAPLDGYVNVDIRKHSPHVDVAHNLREFPWPFEDNSCEHIWFVDVLEHLPDVIGTIDECWRILAPGGSMHVTHVHYQSENYPIDPTHLRGFHDESFQYFDPDTKWGSKYGFYTERKWKLLRVVREGCNVVADMAPRK